MTSQEESDALAVLKDPRLLEIVLDHMHRCGIVGEETNILLAWLVSISRKLERPLGICVRSRSAAGKSFLLEAVASFIPAEDKRRYARLSSQALFYMPENELEHKALFVTEEIETARNDNPLRSIQSDGRIVVACTIKDKSTGQIVTQSKSIKGPVALFLTSTSRSMGDEILNRLLILTLDESQEQTRLILQAQRHARTIPGILEQRTRPRLVALQQNVQRLIRPMIVHNPFAEELGFKDAQLRCRRDQQKHLDLIEVIALVHQHQRPRQSALDSDGRRFEWIEVTREDIERANSLMDAVLEQTTDERSPGARRMLAELRGISLDQPEHKWSRREIRERSGWSDTQVRLVLKQLVELEDVLQFGSGQGRQALYQLAPQSGSGSSALKPTSQTSHSSDCEVLSHASISE